MDLGLIISSSSIRDASSPPLPQGGGRRRGGEERRGDTQLLIVVDDDIFLIGSRQVHNRTAIYSITYNKLLQVITSYIYLLHSSYVVTLHSTKCYSILTSSQIILHPRSTELCTAVLFSYIGRVGMDKYMYVHYMYVSIHSNTVLCVASKQNIRLIRGLYSSPVVGC